MSVQSHIEELERRHAALQREIAFKLSKPGSDPLHLAELKRKKLVLKDEINRLQGLSTIH